jgi:aspartate 1-decarboxylase
LFKETTELDMQIEMFKSKIHRATVTEANLNYVGSITLDENLMNAANLLEHEKVQVVNINNGERLETYVIKGERGSGVVCLNGPAARKVAVGDIIIVISYCLLTPEEAQHHIPLTAHVDANNMLSN